MKRFGRHEELANLAAFLVSDMAEYINGECVVIDGGQWLRGAGEFRRHVLAPRAHPSDEICALVLDDRAQIVDLVAQRLGEVAAMPIEGDAKGAQDPERIRWLAGTIKDLANAKGTANGG